MIILFAVGRKRINAAFIFLIFICLAFTTVQKPTAIVLKDEPLPFTPKEFYVDRVIDERTDKSAVADLIAPVAKGSSPSVGNYSVDLNGGSLTAIKNLVMHNLHADKSLRPLAIGLKKFKVNETLRSDGRVEGKVVLEMSFNLSMEDNDILHFADYNGGSVYTRDASHAIDLEPILRHAIENALVYLNTLMNQRAGTDIKLAKSVKISFTDYQEKDEQDTIYYTTNRPLKWSDFQSVVPSSRFDAEVFPTIGYDEHVSVKNAVVNLNITLKVSLPKSACWAKPASRTDYSLNHEQRHFDIAKIAAEHFRQIIASENLPVENYDGSVNADYLDAYREMNDMQKQYDNETRHGADQFAQQRWNEKIDKELKLYSPK